MYTSGGEPSDYFVGPSLKVGKIGTVISLRNMFQQTPFRVAQIFIGGNRVVYRKGSSEKGDPMIRRMLGVYGGKLYVHASYAYNFCGTAKKLGYIFRGHEGEYYTGAASTVNRNIESMNALLERCAGMGVSGVVVHAGSYAGSRDPAVSRELGMAAAAQSVARLVIPDGVKLLLEGSAGDGAKVPSSLPEMAQMVSYLGQEVSAKVGFCLDTAHLWASGAARFDSERAVDAFDALVSDTVGWSRVHLVHLNNTNVEFGGRRDSHSSLVEKSALWDIRDADAVAGLSRLLWLLQTKRVSVVTETPTPEVDACIARAIMKQNGGV